ncbi:MAG: hypothetical protein HRT56_01945, partial [Coraliomargarita sp.]|nr:hypothetical protein [Coraliomargarita sp.]
METLPRIWPLKLTFAHEDYLKIEEQELKMTKDSFCRALSLLVAFFSFSIAQGVSAQGQGAPPPPTGIDTQSPGGVNLSTGSFSDRVVDLQIGGEGTEGLTLVRIYDSANAGSYSTWAGFGGAQGWTHNWAQRVTDSKVPKVSELVPQCDPLPQPFVNYENCVNAYTYFFHSAVAGDSSL